MHTDPNDANMNIHQESAPLLLISPSIPPSPPAVASAAPQARLRRSYSLRRALVVVFSRPRLIVAVAAVIVLITLLAILFVPARYRSEAKLLVRPGHAPVAIDPTAPRGQTTVAVNGLDKDINSEIELLKNRKLAEAVVAALGPNRILGRKSDAATSAQDSADAIARVEEHVGVKAIPDSSVLAISYESADPQLSRDVVARLIDAFLDERVRVYGDQGELKFFQDQLDGARRRQAQAQRKLRELRDSSGVADAEQQRTLLLKRVDTLQQDIDTAKADLAVANSIVALSRKLAESPGGHLIEVGRGTEIDALNEARNRLLELRQQEIDMATRYRDDAGPLRAIRQKIDGAEKDLTAMATEELNLRLAREIANQLSLQSRIQALQAARLAVQSNLAWIDEVGVKMQTLEQEEALAAGNVTKYAQACEQARLDTQMGQERIGNVAVAEAPVLPLRPEGPPRSLFALAGLLLAMSLGLGSAFVASAFDHTIGQVDHLQSLGLPQVVSIPFVKDYYEPYSHALRPSSRVALTHGAAHPPGEANGDAQSKSEPAPMHPLRALIRNSADPSASGARAPAERGLGDLDLSNGATLMVAEEGNTASIFVRPVGNANRPAGQLAVSARILAAIRGAVDHLSPINGQQAAPRVIGVVGAQSGQGASTIAVHLAIALANRLATGLDQPSSFNRVLLLDSDLESPTSSLLAGTASARGLGDWVAMRISDAEPLAELVMPTRQYLLDILPAGAPRERSSLSPRMPLVLQAMAQRYRQVVVDLPSVMDSDASVQFAGLCDVVVFVCQANELRVEAAQQTLRRLRDAGAKVALAVLNKRRYPVPEWAYRLS